MSNIRRDVQGTQSLMRQLFIRIDGSAVTASASDTGLDEGKTDVDVSRGGAGAENEITIALSESFGRAPSVVATPLSPVNVRIKSVSSSSVVLEVGHIYRVGSDAVEAGTSASVLVATAHAAVAGDWVVMTSGDEDQEMREVSSVATDSITLASALSGSPSATETFDILRPVPVKDADINVLILGSDSASVY